MADSYELVRQKYKPEITKYLLIAESPPPAPGVQSSRQFYYTDRVRRDDRLFINKENWLKRFKDDGWYMIEALEESQEHEVTKVNRQDKIRTVLPKLIERVKTLADINTRIILIKSNVFDVAAEPLRQAGFNVLNTELLDYPGRFNQKAYREKLAKLIN
jgi:hypothetical protein